RDEGGVPDGSGPVVLEHREIGQGDSDATGQLGQTHLLSPQQGVEVTDHAVRIELLHHHTSPSSSSWAACPERKQRRSSSAPPMIPRTTNACIVVMPGPTALTMPRSNATSLVPMVIVGKSRTAPLAPLHSRTPSALIARAGNGGPAARSLMTGTIAIPAPRTVRMSTIFAIQPRVMPAAPRSATGTEIWVRPMSVAEL